MHCSDSLLDSIPLPSLYHYIPTAKPPIVIASNRFIVLHSLFARGVVGPASTVSRLLGLVRFSPHLPDSCRPRSNFAFSPQLKFLHLHRTAPFFHSLHFDLGDFHLLRILRSWNIVGGVINTLQPTPQSRGPKHTRFCRGLIRAGPLRPESLPISSHCLNIFQC